MPRPKRYTNRRTYHTEYARWKRERLLAERNRTSTTCQRKQGAGSCGGLLETIVLEGGRTRIVCSRCERRKRGICQDCPRPVEGRVGTALRCAEHKQARKQEQVREYTARNHDDVLRRARASYRDPERRARRLEYKRAWRKANRAKVREEKRRSYERCKEKIGAYMAAYRAKHRAHYRDIANQKVRERQALWTPPICTVQGCDAVIEHDWVARPRSVTRRRPARCDAHCWPYELEERNRRRALLVEQARAEMLAGVASKSRVARRPPGYFQTRAAGGLRRCLTPGCERVVKGRKKKCSHCKEAEARNAAAILEHHRGRGRRVDLVHVA